MKVLAQLQDEWISSHTHLNILRVDAETLDLARNVDHQRQFVTVVKDRMALLAARRPEPLPFMSV